MLGFSLSAVEPQEVEWTHLTYTASKLFLKATTEVDLETVSDEELAQELIAAPGGLGIKASGTPMRISLESSFAGRRSLSQVLFDPHRGSALQRFKHRFGSKAYQKTQRYLDRQVYSLRRAPNTPEEAGLEPPNWTKIGGTYFDLPNTLADCPVVTDPAVLLYWLSSHSLREGSRTRLCAFSQKAFVAVEIEVESKTQIQVDYTERSRGRAEERQGSTEVFRVLMRPLPGAQGDQEDEFEFLGLEGDVVVFMDPRNRVPVQVSGRLPGIGGGIDIKLSQAVLR